MTDKTVYCLDGDGALIMYMWSSAIAGDEGDSPMIHLVLNIGAHDSVDGQTTVGFTIEIPAIALACDNTESAANTLYRLIDLIGLNVSLRATRLVIPLDKEFTDGINMQRLINNSVEPVQNNVQLVLP